VTVACPGSGRSGSGLMLMFRCLEFSSEGLQVTRFDLEIGGTIFIGNLHELRPWRAGRRILSKVVVCMFLYLPSLLDLGLPQRCDHPAVYCACLLARGRLKEISRSTHSFWSLAFRSCSLRWETSALRERHSSSRTGSTVSVVTPRS
jgi:hypothetical protein